MSNFTKILFLTLSLFTLQTLHSLRTYSQLVSDFRVNDDMTIRAQYAAKCGVDSSGTCISVWEDYRNIKGNIFAQRFDVFGNFLGDNFRINSNPDSSGSPAIAVQENGHFAVCWMDINSNVNFSSKLKFRYFDPNGNPVTNEIIVNDSIGNFDGPLSIGVNHKGEFIIIWSHGNIMFQIVDSSGVKIGTNKRVNDDSGNNIHKNPSISVRQDGSFVITWNDTRPPSMPNSDDIYMQIYDNIGNKVGVNQRVNDDLISTNQQQFPKVSSDKSKNFVIAWSDNRLNFFNSEIYFQLFDSNGNRTGINIRVTQSSTNYAKGICNVIKRPQGEFLVGWSESSTGTIQCYFQKYTSSGLRIGNDYLVSSKYPTANKYYSDVEVLNDRIISMWADTRNGPLDVYCNIRSYTNPDTTVNIIQLSTNVPEGFSMEQNYPNPFNSSTLFSFTILKSDAYKFEIFNLVGQKVYEVFNKHLTPGSFSINFYSYGLASGVYHYVLSSQIERLMRSFVILK